MPSYIQYTGVGDATSYNQRGTPNSNTSEFEANWDDLRFPATAINPPGQASDPDVEATTGLLLFAAAGTETIFALVQMPHSWKEGSVVKPHVHWQKTTSADGDVYWQLDYKKIPIGQVMDAEFTTLFATTPVSGTPDNDTANEHLLTSFDDIDMTGLTLSDCLLCKISRIGGNEADTYGADARLLEFDIHFQINTLGSEQLYTK